MTESVCNNCNADSDCDSGHAKVDGDATDAGNDVQWLVLSTLL